MLANQVKTVPAPLDIAMKASRVNEAQKITETQGSPDLDVLVKIFGALPAIAKPSVPSIY